MHASHSRITGYPRKGDTAMLTYTSQRSGSDMEVPLRVESIEYHRKHSGYQFQIEGWDEKHERTIRIDTGQFPPEEQVVSVSDTDGGNERITRLGDLVRLAFPTPTKEYHVYAFAGITFAAPVNAGPDEIEELAEDAAQSGDLTYHDLDVVMDRESGEEVVSR